MKAVILDDWEKTFVNNNPLIENLKKHFDVQIFHDEPTEDVLVGRISDADVIIPIRERTKFTKNILQQLKNVKLIAQTGAGLAHIDLEEATHLNIAVATTPGGSSAVVELIFGFMIAYSRKLLSLNDELHQGIWTHSIGLGLENKTIGIIGLGNIGSRVAKVAQAFNMKVLAWGPRLTPERAKELGVEYSSLENLLQNSHFVSVSVRLVPETRQLLNENHFRLMRKDAFLINTSRGEVIDEKAFIQVLKEQKIGGAGLDVFTQEPLSTDSPFLNLENVILTPHIGWKTDNMFNQFLSTSIDNILSFFIDKNPTKIANPEVLNSAGSRDLV